MPSTRVLTLLIDVTLAIWGGELGGAKQEAGRPARSLPEHPGRGRCLGQGRGWMEAQGTRGQARGAVCLLEVSPECLPVTQKEERTPKGKEGLSNPDNLQ